MPFSEVKQEQKTAQNRQFCQPDQKGKKIAILKVGYVVGYAVGYALLYILPL